MFGFFYGISRLFHLIIYYIVLFVLSIIAIIYILFNFMIFLSTVIYFLFKVIYIFIIII